MKKIQIIASIIIIIIFFIFLCIQIKYINQDKLFGERELNLKDVIIYSFEGNKIKMDCSIFCGVIPLSPPCVENHYFKSKQGDVTFQYENIAFKGDYLLCNIDYSQSKNLEGLRIALYVYSLNKFADYDNLDLTKNGEQFVYYLTTDGEYKFFLVLGDVDQWQFPHIGVYVYDSIDEYKSIKINYKLEILSAFLIFVGIIVATIFMILSSSNCETKINSDKYTIRVYKKKKSH